MENSVKKPLSWEAREQLKERLALLKKEYAKTVYKLQDFISNNVHLRKEEASEKGEGSPVLDTHQSSSSCRRSQVPVVTFNLEPEVIDIIGCSNVALTSTCESVDGPSAETAASPFAEKGPIKKIDSGVQSRLKLRKKRSSEGQRREVCEAASEVGELVAGDGEPCVRKIEELDPAGNEENAGSPVFNRDSDGSESLSRDAKENVCHKLFHGSLQDEEDTAPLKTRAQEVEGDCMTVPVGRTVTDPVCCSLGDKSTGVPVCENEASILRDPEVLTEDTCLQQAKPNCSSVLVGAPESNLRSEVVAFEPGRLQNSTALCEAPADSPLNSCTLVEGLLFPVEYYVRTTRRMTSCQRRVDLDAVIYSHLGKSRNGGRGRFRKSIRNQNSPVKGSSKAEGEISDTLLLFNSQEECVGGSNEASTQPDSQDPCNIGVESQRIKSNRGKERKRGSGESIKSKLADAELFKDQELAEWTLTDHRLPDDDQHAVTSDVQSEKEGRNESNICRPVPNTKGLHGNTVKNLSEGYDFSNITNFNIKSSKLSQNKPKHIMEPLQNSIKSQTNDVRPFKEVPSDLLTAQGELSVPEHHSGLNSDTDSQEMVPETQQDPSVGISLKKSLSGTRQSFEWRIDSDREETQSQVSQPRRRVRLPKGNGYRRTRAGSRKLTTQLEDETLTCSEPTLPVKKPVVKRLFHSLEVQDFDLPDEEYGRLKEKLRSEVLRKSLLPSQHDRVDCTVETQVETDNWDSGHCENPHLQDDLVSKQATENIEATTPQKSSDCKELSRTPEEPAADGVICPYGQEMPKTTPGHKLSSSVLLSTPSCTPQERSVHQHDRGAGSPVFPSLGFTPASGPIGHSPVLSQSNCQNQNSSQTSTWSHMCEDVQNNDGNCGKWSQTSAEGVEPSELNRSIPAVKEDTLCVLSAREPLDKKDERTEEHFHVDCEMKFSQPEVLNEVHAVEFSEENTVIEEEKDTLTPALPASQLEQKLKRQTLQLISKIQTPSTSCVIDLCTVFWVVKEARTLCITCACETAVFLWAPQQLNQWTNIHTWAFDKVPIIELIPIPDAVNILCVAFGSLEIREVKVLHSTERGFMEHTLLQTGDINAVRGLPGRRLICSCGILQRQRIELSTLSKEGRSERCMQLVPPNEMVLAFSEVEGEAEALIGSTIMSNIVIWNLKTGHLLKRIHLSERYPGTVCQKAYSESGILFVLLSHRYVGPSEGSIGGRVCVLRMVGVNPMSGKSVPVMLYKLPLGWNGRYLDGGVKGQSIAAVVTPGTLVLWNLLSGHISTMLQHDPNMHWSLFHWAEADSCLLARKNDGTVYVYKCVGARTTEI
ncbi:partner and localizer of BRCA2 [Heptranchias perlo]|uniref:partner and localizer of BRCA2 n=1 Tax=Heptranchias perlo TaxID=212740 RepID=UPI0035595962